MKESGMHSLRSERISTEREINKQFLWIDDFLIKRNENGSKNADDWSLVNTGDSQTVVKIKLGIRSNEFQVLGDHDSWISVCGLLSFNPTVVLSFSYLLLVRGCN